ERDRELGVVDLLEARHRLGGRLGLGIGRSNGVVPLDLREEVAVVLRAGVRGRVPGVDVAVRRNGGAVVERPAALDLDVPGLVVGGGDGLGLDFIRLVVGVVVHQRRVERGQDLRATGLTRLPRRKELGLGDTDLDNPRRTAVAAAVAATAATGRQAE